MRALLIDVGTGTQDVLLFDADREIENAIRLVLPSPTVLVARRIRAATEARRAVVLSGATMGGGPSGWAARDHALAGLPLAATPEAARTFDDDLEAVRAMGVRVVEPEAAEALARRRGVVALRLGDLWLDELAGALAPFGVDLHAVDALAFAVFDHGAAPPGVSDRRFRFERLQERLADEPAAGPLAFAYRAAEVPPAFTRLAGAAAAATAWLGRADVPVVAMDTAPAAILGALEDEVVRRAVGRGEPLVAVNLGNFHALAMGLQPEPASPSGVAIGAIFEHHTGELQRAALARFLRRVADGTITNEEVFGSMGHGAHVRDGWRPARRPLLSLTGPRRALLAGHRVAGLGLPALAVPHGDMMQAGSFGLLRALAYRVPSWRDPVAQRLGPRP